MVRSEPLDLAEWSGASDPYSLLGREALAKAAREARLRAMLLAVIFACGFCGLAARAGVVAFTGTAPSPRTIANVALTGTERARIVDRNGNLLAVTVTTYDLYLDASDLWNPRETLTKIGKVLPEIDIAELLKRIDSGRSYVLVKRGLSPRDKTRIHELGEPGVDFKKSQRRAYPQGSLAAHILGFTREGPQGLIGVNGVEAGLDTLIRDEGLRNADIALSIDTGVQYAMEDELAKAATALNAKGGAGIVLDSRSGEVLALASWPTYEPGAGGSAAPKAQRNRAVSDVYEMGSTFKAFTIAAALDLGQITPDALVDTATPLDIGGKLISDHGGDKGIAGGMLTPRQVLIYSSNVGAAKYARDIGDEKLRSFLARLGLLNAAPIEIAHSRAPMTAAAWDRTQIATVGYGHGISVSPLALAAAFSTFANDGVYIPPTVLKRSGADQPPRLQAMSPSTAHEMVNMLRGVVTEGTGKALLGTGYDVAGKTGTGEKYLDGAYRPDRVVASFAAVFPAYQPRYTVLVVLDEPEAPTAAGVNASATAAPVVSKVVRRIGPILGVMPAGGDVGKAAVGPANGGVALPVKAYVLPAKSEMVPGGDLADGKIKK